MIRHLLLPILLLAGPAQAGSQEDAAAAYIAMFNSADFTDLDALIAEDFEGVTMSPGQTPALGREGLRSWISGIHKVMPGGVKTIEATVRDGDAVVVRVSLQAPHPKGGAPIASAQVHWLEFEGGRVVRDRVYFDLGAVFQTMTEDR
ncbi:MAG: nuclear transport factor 2 family protein [Proteobacteria bacterium]|nr:nuclear transport factor 2 family protein [Pseudomonadota bacterium]